jgi:MFS superfamily sulfate permease-like transporter
VSSYPLSEVIELTKSGSVAVGVVTALTMWGCPKITRRVPPALAALAVGTALYYLVGWIYGADVLGPTLGRIAPAATAEATISAVWVFVHPSWLFSTALHVAPYAAFLAFQIVMNAALGAAGVGALLGARSDVDRTLRTQGWINVVCGALGSLPVTTIGSIALQAARMKPVTPTVAALSCGILFLAWCWRAIC